MKRAVQIANRLAEELGLDGGWRIVANVKEDGGQTVRRLHFHLLGDGKLGSFGGNRAETSAGLSE